jgi:hypothetical protein
MSDGYVDSEFPWEPHPAYIHPDHDPEAEDRPGTGD